MRSTPGWKGVPWTNALAYLASLSVAEKKRFYNLVSRVPIKDDFSKNPFIPGNFNDLFKEGKYNKVVPLDISAFT